MGIFGCDGGGGQFEEDCGGNGGGGGGASGSHVLQSTWSAEMGIMDLWFNTRTNKVKTGNL